MLGIFVNITVHFIVITPRKFALNFCLSAASYSSTWTKTIIKILCSSLG